jgi:histidyl-tRNA synthetase
MLDALYHRLGVPDVTLHLNTIGDDQCRPAYRTLLVDYLQAHTGSLCAECRARIDTNPLRTFDCKNPACRAVMADAPVQNDHLCEPCATHFATVRALLDAAGITYTLDTTLVRGLDYYTRTTFEFKCARLGAQDGIGGGGRYDGLAATLGGPPTPAVGFGSGIERIALAMAEAAIPPLDDADVDIYLCIDNDDSWPAMFALLTQLRAKGVRVEADLAGRSLKGQLKQASRLGALLSVVARADGTFVLHSMHGRNEEQLNAEFLADTILLAFEQAQLIRDDH